ncbi:ABC transporter permease [Celeribacter sp.]|uniref:ABC transporter permease n=1 Tax=Celeribacter sp. TaxID=1890673 RepID=UPI003A91E657
MKRLANKATQLATVLVISSFMVFAIGALLPGDPTLTVLGENATVQQRAQLREELGLDDPIIVRYAHWAVNSLRGDLGTSLRTQEPVGTIIAERLPITLELTFLSVVLAVVVGIPLGVASAKWRGGALDLGIGVVGLSSLAVPYFWLGILLILFFSIRLGWVPPSGHVPFFEDPLENLRLMILPVLTVGTAMVALVMRQTRTAMLEALSQDYVRTARAKGTSEAKAVLYHALRNALNPIVTIVGLQFGALMGGAVVTETIFSMPGLGRLVVDGIFNRDLAVVQGAILTIVLCVVVINLLTDLLYSQLDPRIKL